MVGSLLVGGDVGGNQGADIGGNMAEDLIKTVSESTHLCSIVVINIVVKWS